MCGLHNRDSVCKVSFVAEREIQLLLNSSKKVLSYSIAQIGMKAIGELRAPKLLDGKITLRKELQ